MSDEIHLDDIGIEFRVTISDDGTVVDVSGASTTNLIFRKPDGTLSEVSAGFYTDGTDGIISYYTVSGDLDQSGLYKIQAYVVIGASSYKSSIGSFRVHCNL